MTGSVVRRTGQPVLALAAVLLVWVSARVILWETPFSVLPEYIADPISQISKRVGGHSRQSTAVPNSDGQNSHFSLSTFAGFNGPVSTNRLRQGSAVAIYEQQANPIPFGSNQKPALLLLPESLQSSSGTAQNNSLTTEQSLIGVARSKAAKRWSGSGWVFWRDGSSTLVAAGQSSPTYGGSQLGAVLRYSIRPSDPRDPSAYIRTTASLSGPGQNEIAVGGAIRQVIGVPISAAAEIRASRSGSQTDFRPAAFAVTELPTVALPLGFRGEAYIQAGYVGGDFATGFADGKIQADRKIADFDLGTVRLGAGAWGGIQKDASRLDVGPTASVDFKVAGSPIRATLDYRHRIAGNANPQSGAALTVSTGF